MTGGEEECLRIVTGHLLNYLPFETLILFV